MFRFSLQSIEIQTALFIDLRPKRRKSWFVAVNVAVKIVVVLVAVRIGAVLVVVMVAAVLVVVMIVVVPLVLHEHCHKCDSTCVRVVDCVPVCDTPYRTSSFLYAEPMGAGLPAAFLSLENRKSSPGIFLLRNWHSNMHQIVQELIRRVE